MNKKRIGLNIIALTILEIFNKISPLIVMGFAQRKLGLAAFGSAQFTMNLVDTVALIITFGYGVSGPIEVGRLVENPIALKEKISDLFSARLLHGLLAFAVLALIVAVNPEYKEYQTSALILGSFFFVTSAIDMSFVLLATQKLLWITFLSAFAKIASLIMILVFIEGPDDQLIYAVITMGANSMMAMISFAIIQKKFPFSISFVRIFATLKNALPTGFAAMLVVAFERFDMFVVEKYFPIESVGIYAGCQRLVKALQPFLVSISSAFFSEIVALSDHESFAKHIRTATLILSVCALPIFAGSFFVATPILEFVYGPEFASAGPLFAILAGTLFGQTLIWLGGYQVLMRFDKTWWMIGILTIALIVTCGVSMYFAEQHKFLAVAATSTIGTCAAGVIIFLRARPLIRYPVLRSIYIPLIATAIMFAFLYTIDSKNFWLNITVGGILYSGIIFTLSSELRGLSQKIMKRAFK